MTTLLTAAEFVLPGHPDKLCDAVADALVQESARRQTGCGERYTGRADLVDVARWGHFTTAERPWEALHFDRP
jgi:S-adenosylmethionine synthetase